jgi:hypothetical protein
MVSPKVFLSAGHFFPANDVNVTFYTGNDPSGSSLTRAFSYSERIGTTDLRIGYLDQALSADYAYYDIASASINDTHDFVNSYYNTDAYLFGRSNTNYYEISQDMAVGRNKIDFWTSEATVTYSDNLITTDMALMADYS